MVIAKIAKPEVSLLSADQAFKGLFNDNSKYANYPSAAALMIGALLRNFIAPFFDFSILLFCVIDFVLKSIYACLSVWPPATRTFLQKS